MKPRKVIEDSEYTISDFIQRTSVNAPGNPLFGDCLNYSCVYNDLLDGDGILCVFYLLKKKQNPQCTLP